MLYTLIRPLWAKLGFTGRDTATGRLLGLEVRDVRKNEVIINLSVFVILFSPLSDMGQWKGINICSALKVADHLKGTALTSSYIAHAPRRLYIVQQRVPDCYIVVCTRYPWNVCSTLAG